MTRQPTTTAWILYARAAFIERLAHAYGRQGHDRLRELGIEIADGVERIADAAATRRGA